MVKAANSACFYLTGQSGWSALGNNGCRHIGGMPVVAGPIVVLVALEQGVGFGIYTATAAVTGVIALLSFGIAYCWLSLKLNWWMTFFWQRWFGVLFLAFWYFYQKYLSCPLYSITRFDLHTVLITSENWVYRPAAHAKDLPVRMLAGGVFTLIVTQAADLVVEHGVDY